MSESVSTALFWIVFIALLSFLVSPVFGGERLQCWAEPQGANWHYRTRVPGYAGDVRGDKCWYDGQRMKAREELYWPAPDALPITAKPPWEMEERWCVGACPGWMHKE